MNYQASKSRVAEKIAKLLRLARSPNEHEAALAAAKARDLLQAHNLSVGEIELESEPSYEGRLRCAARPSVWFTCLVRMVEKHFQVETIIIGAIGRNDLAVCGLRTNVEAAMLTLRYLVRSLDILVAARGTQLRKKGKRSVRANVRRVQSYKQGAARRIAYELQEQTARQSEAIVRIGTAIARRHIEDRYKNRTRVKCRRAKRNYEELLGWIDGKKVNPFGARPQLGSGA